ncbi:rhomboid protease PCP1 [Ascoidea rubescens DSM 1968]|uniref:Rhomboid-domain-containing protein n=1 Tax=Ascoidea rubescens DSM 1968 TaxID=1344418 RepID=A0A1D2VGV6_9ASCO|nr:rhomboid-domain-containing protein [Ascoidea rubescens DSM 1968]ODV60822.1 rhomboid-domain-containing protein [Ascoidea rubescens DSM 1968]
MIGVGTRLMLGVPVRRSLATLPFTAVASVSKSQIRLLLIVSSGKRAVFSGIPSTELRNFSSTRCCGDILQNKGQLHGIANARPYGRFNLRNYIGSSKILLLLKRNYATYRDLGYIKSYNFNSGSDRRKNFIRATIFAILFMAASSFIVPKVVSNVFPGLKRNPNLLIYGILGLNGIVFLLWRASASNARSFAKLSQILNKVFLMNSFKTNFPSMIFSTFSHQDFFHLLFNMLCLYSFGSSLVHIIGPSNFLTMYLNSGVFASWFSLLASLFRLSATSAAIYSLGASGALFGVFGCFSYLLPSAGVSIFFFPIPGGAWNAFLLSNVGNVLGIVLKWGSFDYAAHLGGALLGCYYGYLIKKKHDERSRRRSSSLFDVFR